MGQSVSKDSTRGGSGELFIYSFLLGERDENSSSASCPFWYGLLSCGNLDCLKDDVIPHFMAFNAPEELYSMALTCKKLLFFVESYARDAFKESIKNTQKKHNVDPEWRARVEEYITVRSRSTSTFRRKLRLAAHEKLHLYTIPSDTIHFAMPTGEAVIWTGGVDGRVRKWDLKTRECIQTSTDSHERRIDAIVTCDGKIVSINENGAMVWSMDGDLLLSIQTENILRPHVSVAVVGSCVFCCASQNNIFRRPYIITEMNVLSGQVKRHDWTNTIVERFFAAEEYLLVYGSKHERQQRQKGVFVFDALDLTNKHLSLLRDSRFSCITCSQDQTYIAGYHSLDGPLDDPYDPFTHVITVMTMNDGNLNVLWTTEISEGTEQSHLRWKPLLVHGSHVYFAIYRRAALVIYMIDITNGQVVNKMHYSVRPFAGRSVSPFALATDGHELFCSFAPNDVDDSPRYWEDTIIMSFPVVK